MPLVSTYTHTQPDSILPDVIYIQWCTIELSFSVCVCVCVLGEGPDFTMTDEEVEAQAHRCNKKKKPAKTIEVHT